MRFKDEERFNHGLLEYGKVETVRNATKKIIGETFNADGELYYNFYNIRQSDNEVYGTTDQAVDLKVKTFYIPSVNKSQKVLLNGDVYNITSIDPTADRRYMFWYLSKVGALNLV